MNKYPLGNVTDNKAWKIAATLNKPAPYRGYALDLRNGQMLVCDKRDGKTIFEIKDKPQN